MAEEPDVALFRNSHAARVGACIKSVEGVNEIIVNLIDDNNSHTDFIEQPN